ncbi:MAG: hypothetical protein AB8G18_12605 [Gammaproteobacteria bacterium]
MGDNTTTDKDKKDGDQVKTGTGGPVIIPAAAAFVGAVLGAVVGSQLGG